MAEQIDSAMIPDERVCIVPVGYDIGVDGDPGCPIVEDVNLPNPITKNSRYVLANPFGANSYAIVKEELFHNSRWAYPGQNHGTNIVGTKASVVLGEGVVVQTGVDHALGLSNNSLGGHANTTGTVTSVPCRVYVTRGKQ